MVGGVMVDFEARFEAALAARGLTPEPADHAAALRIAWFLEGCARLLEAEAAEADDAE
jgi:hypothetical protein